MHINVCKRMSKLCTSKENTFTWVKRYCCVATFIGITYQLSNKLSGTLSLSKSQKKKSRPESASTDKHGANLREPFTASWSGTYLYMCITILSYCPCSHCTGLAPSILPAPLGLKPKFGTCAIPAI